MSLTDETSEVLETLSPAVKALPQLLMLFTNFYAMLPRQLLRFEVLSLTAVALLSFAWIMVVMPKNEDKMPLLTEENLELLNEEKGTAHNEMMDREKIESEKTATPSEAGDVPQLANFSNDAHKTSDVDADVREVLQETVAAVDKDQEIENRSTHGDTVSECNTVKDDAAEDDCESTSTFQYAGYDHESWTTYEAKVASFCQNLWPSLKPDEIIIERMKGGRDNRIVGVTLQPQQDLLPRFMRRVRAYAAGRKPAKIVPTRYVLRIPRDAESRDLRADIGLLEYVRSLNVPVPTTVKADYTSNNALERPYLLQHRIPGRDLSYLWDDLNHKQRLCLAKQIAEIQVKITSQRSPVCGEVIGVRSRRQYETWGKPAATPEVVPPSFMKYAAKGSEDLGRSYWQNPPRLMVPASLREWQHYRPWIMPWGELAALTESMQEVSGAWGSEEYWFCHGDFWPRNMLAEVTGPNTARITGIMDWDLSSFAPAIIACSPPVWMWQWQEYCRADSGRPEELDLDKLAAQTPLDAESRKIKKCFEDIVGAEHVKYALHQDGNLARHMYEWVISGTMIQDHDEIAEGMIAEWEERHGEIERTDSDEDEDTDAELEAEEVWCEAQQ